MDSLLCLFYAGIITIIIFLIIAAASCTIDTRNNVIEINDKLNKIIEIKEEKLNESL